MYDNTVPIKELGESFPDSIFITSLIQPRRPGTVLFLRMLELRHYPPNSQLNDRYEVVLHSLDNDIIEVILIIPKEDFNKARLVAEECNLVINRGTHLFLTSDSDIKPSYLPEDRSFCIVNSKDHICYSIGFDVEGYYRQENKMVELEEQAYLERIG